MTASLHETVRTMLGHAVDDAAEAFRDLIADIATRLHDGRMKVCERCAGRGEVPKLHRDGTRCYKDAMCHECGGFGVVDVTK